MRVVLALAPADLRVPARLAGIDVVTTGGAAGSGVVHALAPTGVLASAAWTSPVLGTCEVVDVATGPEHRGQGFATLVTAAAVTGARRSGADLVWLRCAPGTAGLYRRLGFTDTGADTLTEGLSGSG